MKRPQFICRGWNPFIFFEDEKAHSLLEQFHNGHSLAVFTDGGEPVIQPIENLDAVQIRYEQGQACPSSQPVGDYIKSKCLF